MHNLDGKVALVTGGTRGIGRGIAEAFLSAGASVAINGRSAEKGAATIRELSAGDRAFYVAGDVTQKEEVEAMVDATLAQFGRIDILVNNAGAIPSGSLWDVDEEAWRKGWDLKVMGYINLCRLFYKKMQAAGAGVIINNIGNGGEVFDAKYIAGTTGNASLMAFTRALGGNSLADNIRVVGVNPGPVDTDRIYNMLKKRAASELGDANRYKELEANYPLGRPAHKYEISDLIVFLASFRSGYTSGAIFTVDGGITSRRSII